MRRRKDKYGGGKRGMLLLLQEQTCLAFFSLSVAVSENVLGPASAKCPRLTGINGMHMHLRYFSWSRAPCTSFLKAAVCLGPLSSQDLWLFWMAVAPWRGILRASSASEHCLENFLNAQVSSKPCRQGVSPAKCLSRASQGDTLNRAPGFVLQCKQKVIRCCGSIGSSGVFAGWECSSVNTLVREGVD